LSALGMLCFSVVISGKSGIIDEVSAINISSDVGGSVSGASATDFTYNLVYGAARPSAETYLAKPGTLTWPSEVAAIPTVANSGEYNNVRFVSEDATVDAIVTVQLTVSRADFTPPAILTLNYGDLKQSVISLKNATHTTETVDCNILWPSLPDYLAVSDSGNYYLTFTNTNPNYNASVSGNVNVTVSPYSITASKFSLEFDGKYSYLTSYADIEAAIKEEIRISLNKISGLPNQIKTELLAGVTILVDGVIYGGAAYVPVKWNGSDIESYEITATLYTNNVSFGGSSNLPNVDAQFTIERFVIRAANISDIQEDVFDGSAQTTEITFTSSQGAFIPNSVGITYTYNGVGIESPTLAGTYRAKIVVNEENFVTEYTGIEVDYIIRKAPASDIEALAIEIEYNNWYQEDGILTLQFTYSSNTPVITDTTRSFNNDLYDLTWKISVENNQEIVNVGQYNVTFIFSSPNYEGTFTYLLIYDIVAVSAYNPAGGIFTVMDYIFPVDVLVLEYSGAEYTAQDIVEILSDFNFAKYNLSYTTTLYNVSGLSIIKNIDSYIIYFEFASTNHLAAPVYTGVHHVDVTVVKRNVKIPKDIISVKFDGDVKAPIPAVSTGIVGMPAELEIVKITRDGIVLENAITAGEYKFTYAVKGIVGNEYMYAEETEVTVIIARASQAELVALIKQYVKFNNTGKITDKNFRPEIISNDLDAKYGISFISNSPENLKDIKDYNVVFTFASDNYLITNGILEYTVNYALDPTTNWALVGAIAGGVVGLIGIIYLVFFFIGRARRDLPPIRPENKKPTISGKPQYKVGTGLRK
jgi:hypothetical protein